MELEIIILYYDESILTKSELWGFKKGDLIWGDNSDPRELKRWMMANEQEAVAELAKCRCSYNTNDTLSRIEEYALAYCTTDPDGEIINLNCHYLALQDLDNLYEEKREAIRNEIEYSIEAALGWCRKSSIYLFEEGIVRNYEVRTGECCSLTTNWREDGFLVASIISDDIRNEPNFEEDNFFIEEMVDKIMDTASKNIDLIVKLEREKNRYTNSDFCDCI